MNPSTSERPILYHLCAEKDLASVLAHGLDPRFSKEPACRERMVYLSADAFQAMGYVGHHDDDEKAVLLRVLGADLDGSLLCADNVDLPDLLEQDEDERDWSEVGWSDSLRRSGQCGYTGRIPASSLEAVRCHGGKPGSDWVSLSSYVRHHSLDSGSGRDASFEAALYERTGGEFEISTKTPGEPFSGHETTFEVCLRGRPVAEMSVFKSGMDGFRLTWIGVNPSFQGKGIGGMLLDRLKEALPPECASLEFADVKSLGMRDLIERKFGCELRHHKALGLGRAPTRDEAWSGVASRSHGTSLKGIHGTSGYIDGEDLVAALNRASSPAP